MSTSTLVGKLLDGPPEKREETWRKLVTRLTPSIVAWAHRWHLSSQTDDLCQDVLLALYKGLRTFRREKARFRVWFNTVLKRQLFVYLRKKQYFQSLHEANEAEALDDLGDSFMRTHQREIEEVALKKAQSESSEKEWNAFFQVVLQERCADDVAHEMNLKPATVHRYCLRVKERVKTHQEQIEAEL